jgi:hypothetical protein
VGIGLSYASGALNHYYGWRASLRIWGVPGVLVAALCIVVLREPERAHPPQLAISRKSSSSMGTGSISSGGGSGRGVNKGGGGGSGGG